jgi:predicted transcriptional regulator
MDPSENYLFLSLRPEYAKLLLQEVKTVELRRIRPRASAGTRILLYAASPQCELVGHCRVAEIGQAAPDVIWKLHGSKTGIQLKAYRAYFDGSAKAVAITVENVVSLESPIPLSSLRAKWIDFQPPQSFRYIPMEEAEHLIARTTVLA